MTAAPVSSQDLGNIVRELIEALSVGDRARYQPVLADNLTYHLTGSHPFSGKVEGKEALLGMIGQVRGFFADDSLRYTVDRIIVSGNTVVSTYQGTGKMPSGNEYKNDYCTIWDFEGNKIVRITEFFDSYHVAQNIG